MRLLHTSDWHLGRRLYDQELLAYQSEFLRWLLDTAVLHDVSAVVVAGDVYDRAVPPPEAVQLLDRTFTAFARAKIELILTSGNHDSAVRLGFGGGLSEAAGVHLRTKVADLDRPVVLSDEFGTVGCYGIPYLLPDAVMTELGSERSHTAVLAAAADRIRADAAARALTRTVVVAHAFVTGATECGSERDIRVGGVADVAASVFAGLGYIALGHLHGAQTVSSPPGATVAYSGSPLAFSFSERQHTKSVTLVEIDREGATTLTRLPTPVPRTLREVRGTLDGLLARAHGDLSDCRDAWVKVVLTDAARPTAPLERLRAVWPHTLVLDFQPSCGIVDPAADLARLATITDPVEICAQFVRYVDNVCPDAESLQVLRESVEAATARDSIEVGS